MIILMDGNVWQKLVEKNLRNGTVILESHFMDDGMAHWVKDIGGSRLLGEVELVRTIHTDISSIDKRYVKAAGVGSKELLQRLFHTILGKKVDAISVAEMRILNTEKYWCPYCQSVNLDFLKKYIIKTQLPFGCFDCGKEFYTEDIEKDGPPWTKHPKLEKRYCREEIKKIPSGQQTVLAIAGEQWLEM